ncbi:Abi family protein [Vibrio anguillarum]|nr:Abi family protein [Vibrio anguillarum]MBF4289742.1 Abi family protein [Vibrio anguillarum]MBF4342677.1 Abi family protein [Vibrio anguillarum]MBF4358396.1 Abi family protein [Vibrio anguillarum]MBF4381011.1 Abi family protein [Vibrio anguillarum]
MRLRAKFRTITVPNLILYNKSYLSSSDLCAKLQGQGLTIHDVENAKNELERCSYYRFKAYLFPFKDLNTKTYNTGSTFEQGYELYHFDSELRAYLFRIIEKVEIGVRSALDQWVTGKTGNPFWYLDSSLFNSNGDQIKTVTTLRSMFISSKEEYALHYRGKYYNDYCRFYRELPPAWVALELMTFGNILSLMDSFTTDSVQNLKLNRFANNKLGVNKYQSLTNWMGCIRHVRNACGHHNRLFNRNLTAPTGIKRVLNRHISLVRTNPQSGTRQTDQVNRIYTNICAIQKIYTGLGHEEKLGPALAHLFEKYPTAKLFRESMGFPAQWHQEPLLFNFTAESNESSANISQSNLKLALWCGYEKLFRMASLSLGN